MDIPLECITSRGVGRLLTNDTAGLDHDEGQARHRARTKDAARGTMPVGMVDWGVREI